MALKLTVRVGKKSKTFGSVTEAAKFFKMPYEVLYTRLFLLKWPMAKAVKTKIRKRATKVVVKRIYRKRKKK